MAGARRRLARRALKNAVRVADLKAVAPLVLPQLLRLSAGTQSQPFHNAIGAALMHQDGGKSKLQEHSYTLACTCNYFNLITVFLLRM